MEEKEGINGSGVVVVNPTQYGGSTAQPPPPAAPPPVIAAAPPPEFKKKRGRPRKYASDGSAVALSPMPISASIPLTGDYSAWKQSASRPVDSFKKKQKLEFGSQGGAVPYSGGGNFTPHVITVNAGEDVNMKIISFSQQGSQAICILAANGTISNVTLRQSNTSGGTLTYEGNFEILSLSGSFISTDNGSTKSRSGGMSVTLAGPDGRVFGGGLAGMLVAAGSIQVVIGSFFPGQHHEQKPKKPKYEHTITFGSPTSDERYKSAHNGPNPILTSSGTFHHGNSIHVSNFTQVDNNNNVSLPGEDSRNQSH